MDQADIRLTRLFDLAEDERVHVRCVCGASVIFHPAAFPKKYRVPSDTLLYDLQYRLRCRHCNRNHSFEIAIGSTRMIGSSSQAPPVRVVVPMSNTYGQVPVTRKLTLVEFDIG